MPLLIPGYLLSTEGLEGTPSDPCSFRGLGGAPRGPLWPELREVLWGAVESNLSGLGAQRQNYVAAKFSGDVIGSNGP